MAKIQGLDQFMRKMNDFQTALGALEGELGSVSFDPNDPASIEQAIQQIEATIDERVRNFEYNDIVKSIVAQMKEKYREAILERAARARLENEGE